MVDPVAMLFKAIGIPPEEVATFRSRIEAMLMGAEAEYLAAAKHRGEMQAILIHIGVRLAALEEKLSPNFQDDPGGEELPRKPNDEANHDGRDEPQREPASGDAGAAGPASDGGSDPAAVSTGDGRDGSAGDAAGPDAA